MGTYSPESIKQAIRSAIKDKAVADALIARLKDEELANGTINITEEMINDDLRATILDNIPKGMLKDYRVGFRDGFIHLSFTAEFMLKLKADYKIRVTGFSFSPEKGHRIKGTYTEECKGVPKIMLGSHKTVLGWLSEHAPAGVAADDETFDIRMDDIPQFRQALSQHSALSGATVRMGRVSGGCLTLSI
ncbi:MAG: hypothetical protein E7559_00735 [Ruminococcaceae bacterium]|nr:hypothetical protein [Oscillospiraceae bacterium]